MATFKAHKVVAALPAPLEANSIYAVRIGEGFDLYFTDSTGSIAHKVNPNGWIDFVAWPSSGVGPATVSGVSGDVRSHTKGGRTVYRFIPSPYDASKDGFYTGFAAGTLSGLIVTRG